MSTKSELLELLPTNVFGEFIDQINFENLDKFVQMLVSGYVSRRSQEVVKREIDADSPSDTSNFLTHIIEVGSLKIMQDSTLISSDKDKNEGAVVVTAFSLNFSMASALKAKDVYDFDSTIYYGIPEVETIIPRIVSHLNNAVNDSLYAKSLLNNYLYNKI